MKNALSLLAVTSLVSAASFAGISSNINKTFNVAGPGRLVVDIDSGDVKVRAGAPGEVAVQIFREVSTGSQEKARELINEFSYAVTQSGDTITVKIDNKRNVWFSWGLGPQLKLKAVVIVPKAAAVEIMTSGGDVDVADIDGALNAKSSGGDIELARLGGTVKARTSGGNVVARQVRTNFEVGTSGGDITIEGAPAGVSAHTSGGDVRISAAGGVIIAKTSGGDIDLNGVAGEINARTSGGDVIARFAASPQRDVVLSTSGGGVRLVVPVNSNFELDAETSGGEVSSSLAMTVQGKQNDDRLVGRVNRGGPRVRLRSSSGDIIIASR